GAEGFDAVSGAQLGNGNAQHFGRAHDAGALGHGDFVAVDFQGHQFRAGAFGGAEIDFGSGELRVEDDRLANGTFDDGIHWKSPLKCFTALITGIGVRPPMAHTDAASMVSHRSLRMMCCRSRSLLSCAATMRSMVSMPRTEPMRQGVHLPQLSTEQNSMEKRAIFAMLTPVSNTTTPPWPSMPPALANSS